MSNTIFVGACTHKYSRDAPSGHKVETIRVHLKYAFSTAFLIPNRSNASATMRELRSVIL